MSKKRKASELADSQPEQPAKRAALDANAAVLTAGEKRQAKSERRTKKAGSAHTRDAALERVKGAKVKKDERKEAKRQARAAPAPKLDANPTPFLPRATVSNGEDSLASGSDFVPLFAEDTNPTPVNLEDGSIQSNPKHGLQPKRSKKGLSRDDRKAKTEALHSMQVEKSEKKKEKKLHKKSKTNPDPASTTQPSEQADTTPDSNGTMPTNKSHRFILFIGNLPFSTTTPSLEKHFESLQPFTLRHSTQPGTTKSKGFAFIEFENYDKMQTCIKLYHHSYFNPEQPGEGEPATALAALEDQEQAFKSHKKKGKGQIEKDKGRRINVELTAGGGGKGKDRKEKIKAKNQKLSDQRERKVQKEKSEREQKRNEDAAKGPATGVNADAEADVGRGDIHPSRMARVPG